FKAGTAESSAALGGSRDLTVPLVVESRRVGVLIARGVRASDRMAEASAMVLGLALEHEHFLRIAGQAEAARARDEMRSTFLATLGHDLKTPLAVARGALENWEAAGGVSKE